MIYLILLLIVMAFVIYKVQLIYRKVFLTFYTKERQTLPRFLRVVLKTLSSKLMIKQIWLSNAYFTTLGMVEDNSDALNDALDKLEAFVKDIELTVDDVLFDVANSTGARKEHVLIRSLQTYVALSLQGRVTQVDLTDLNALLTTDIPNDTPGIPVPTLLKLYERGVNKHQLNGQVTSLTFAHQIARLVKEVKKDK